MSHPLTVGLTGGVAAGKSVAADAFASLGVPVRDADEVARAVVAPGQPALAAIVRSFGAGFLQADGTLDRRRMREHVFADDAARRALEQITHPRIIEALQAWRDAQSGPYCMLAIPILVETRLADLVDRILVIDVPEAVQQSRLVDRDGIDASLARRMIAAQASRADRLARADDVIDNTASTADLQAAIKALDARYRGLAHPADGRDNAGQGGLGG